jgi:2-dehydropantoate 2-reductase
MTDYRTIVIYGAGAVGSSIAGWIIPEIDRISVLARGEHAEVMRKNGLSLSIKGETASPVPISVDVISDLAERPETDVVILTVKNYSLDDAAKDIKKNLRKQSLIVAMQNGIENRKILPRYFNRVIYGVVCYNSWIEAPGIIGASGNGPILLGVADGDAGLKKELSEIAALLGRGMDIRITDDLINAVYSKMVMNLTNSVLTLVGQKFRPIESIRALKKVMVGTIIEGAEIAKNAGYREVGLPGMPSMKMIRISSRLPEFVSDFSFKKNIAGVGINSMGQDILVHHRKVTELDSLNGYFIDLADRLKMEAPYNRTIYETSKELFARIPFVPISESELWKRIQKRLKSG